MRPLSGEMFAWHQRMVIKEKKRATAGVFPLKFKNIYQKKNCVLNKNGTVGLAVLPNISKIIDEG